MTVHTSSLRAKLKEEQIKRARRGRQTAARSQRRKRRKRSTKP